MHDEKCTGVEASRRFRVVVKENIAMEEGDALLVPGAEFSLLDCDEVCKAQVTLEPAKDGLLPSRTWGAREGISGEAVDVVGDNGGVRDPRASGVSRVRMWVGHGGVVVVGKGFSGHVYR